MRQNTVADYHKWGSERKGRYKYNYFANFVIKIQLQNIPEVHKIVIKILVINILPNTVDAVRSEIQATGRRSEVLEIFLV